MAITYYKDVDIYKCMLVKESTEKYEAYSIKVGESNDLAKLACSLGYNTFAEEVLGLFVFNCKGKVTGYHEVSRGDIVRSVLSPREILKRALLNNAASIAIVHNHPSGDPTPSTDDVSATKRLKDASDIMGIKLLDHIIIGESDDYRSMRALGLIIDEEQ